MWWGCGWIECLPSMGPWVSDPALNKSGERVQACHLCMLDAEAGGLGINSEAVT